MLGFRDDNNLVEFGFQNLKLKPDQIDTVQVRSGLVFEFCRVFRFCLNCAHPLNPISHFYQNVDKGTGLIVSRQKKRVFH